MILLYTEAPAIHCDSIQSKCYLGQCRTGFLKGQKSATVVSHLTALTGREKKNTQRKNVFLYTNNMLLFKYPKTKKNKLCVPYQALTLLCKNLHSCFSCKFKEN